MPAIAYQYDDDTRDILAGLERFLKVEVFARHQANERLLSDSRYTYTEDGRYAPEVLKLISEVRQASAKAGYYTLCVPTDLGGGGFGTVTYFALWERIFHLCGPHQWLGHFLASHWSKGPSPALAGLSPSLRERLLPGLNAGELTLCFALSEPGAGSDALALKTKAVADGDDWILSGGKIWTTNSPYADYAMVFAITDPEALAEKRGGISLFLVPTNAPGFQIERVIRMWGSTGGDEAILHFDNIRLGPEMVVGKLGRGFDVAMLGIGLGRLYNAARAVGLGRWALEIALEYSKVRKTQGKAISTYQGVSFPLAESAMELHAAHLMSLNTAQLMDQGHKATKEIAMSKAFATQAGARAVDRAIQTHGAMGFTNEMHLTEAYTILRKNQVSDGTNEILRRNIAKSLLAGDTDL